MAELDEYQFELAGVVYGGGRPIVVSTFTPGPADPDTADVDMPGEDGIRMGRDFYRGVTYSVDGAVVTDSAADAWGHWRALAAAWNARAVRTDPGAVTPLRMRMPGLSTTRVYGRPRSIGLSTTRHVGQGVLPFAADFQAVDHRVYSDELSSVTMSGVAIQYRTLVNLIVNPSFEEDAGHWNAVKGTLSRDASVTRFGSASGRYDSDTVATGFRYIESERLPVTGGEVYTGSVYALEGATFTGVWLNFQWFDSAGTSIRNDGQPVASLNDTWTRYHVTHAAPETAVEAELEVVFDPDPGSTAAHAFVDAVMLTRAEELFDYFDGSFDSAYWTGDPHDSTSKRLSGGIVWPAVWPLEWSELVTADTLVTNAGDTDTWPIITFHGPRHEPSVEYVGTDVSVGLAATLRHDERVTVDTRPWARTALRHDGASYAGALRGSRLAELALPPGSTEVALRGRDDTGLSFATIEWRDAYVSL